MFFCVFGWRARLLLSTATSASCVFVSGGVHGFFLITNTITSFGFSGWRARLFLIIITITNFVFARMVCAVIFNYCYYCECCFFVFGWCDRLFLITIANTSFVVRVVCTVHFELLQIGPIVCQSLHKQREEAIVDVNVHEDFLATD